MLKPWLSNCHMSVNMMSTMLESCLSVVLQSVIMFYAAQTVQVWNCKCSREYLKGIRIVLHASAMIGISSSSCPWDSLTPNACVWLWKSKQTDLTGACAGRPSGHACNHACNPCAWRSSDRMCGAVPGRRELYDALVYLGPSIRCAASKSQWVVLLFWTLLPKWQWSYSDLRSILD